MLSAVSNEFAIQCESLSKHYGDVRAVQNLILKIPYGAVFGFLGRNGAGKTTTIRLLTGLAHPTSGKAWVAGMEVTRADSTARQLFGYLPQAPAFYPWMTPHEYLDYVGRIFGMSKEERQQRTHEMLELVDLLPAEKRRIGGFSGGMIQRLGIAQALVHSPQVLFLDEPTSSLDPAGRYEVLELINRLHGQVTIFLSSHILGDVERVCDLLGIIRQGELLLVTGRDELLEQYATNAIELEFDPSMGVLPEELLNRLKEQPWVAGVQQNQHLLRITVTNTSQAKQCVLGVIGGSVSGINRYEWVHPTLEEVFLKLSE